MIVREQRPGDDAEVRELLSLAFGGAAEADLVERLHRDGDVAFALVAEEDGIAGHILLSRLDAPLRALALAPLAVLPERQRRGIGGRLVRAALERARQDGWEAMFVLGDPDYYRRFGFDAALTRGFDSPYSGPAFMVLALSGELSASTGRVGYPAAFAAL